MGLPQRPQRARFPQQTVNHRHRGFALFVARTWQNRCQFCSEARFDPSCSTFSPVATPASSGNSESSHWGTRSKTRVLAM